MTYRALVLILAMGMLGFAGCGSDSENSSAASGTPWTGTWQGMSDQGARFTATLVQADTSVSGTVVRADGIHGTISGAVNGNQGTWTTVWTVPGYSASPTGAYAATLDGDSISGTWTEVWGTTQLQGTFTAARQ